MPQSPAQNFSRHSQYACLHVLIHRLLSRRHGSHLSEQSWTLCAYASEVRRSAHPSMSQRCLLLHPLWAVRESAYCDEESDTAALLTGGAAAPVAGATSTGPEAFFRGGISIVVAVLSSRVDASSVQMSKLKNVRRHGTSRASLPRVPSLPLQMTLSKSSLYLKKPC